MAPTTQQQQQQRVNSTSNTNRRLSSSVYFPSPASSTLLGNCNCFLASVASKSSNGKLDRNLLPLFNRFDHHNINCPASRLYNKNNSSSSINLLLFQTSSPQRAPLSLRRTKSSIVHKYYFTDEFLFEDLCRNNYNNNHNNHNKYSSISSNYNHNNNNNHQNNSSINSIIYRNNLNFIKLTSSPPQLLANANNNSQTENNSLQSTEETGTNEELECHETTTTTAAATGTGSVKKSKRMFDVKHFEFNNKKS